MTITELLALMRLAQIAMPAGAALVGTLTALIKAAHGPQMSEADLNAALGLIFNEETQRHALAVSDALGA